MSERTVTGPMNDKPISVRPQAPATEIVAVLTEYQLATVPVIDENGVQVGVVAMADLLSTGEDDPTFAGLGRRRWWDLPEGATAADLMAAVEPRRVHTDERSAAVA